jgi:hypothetical protein
MSATRCDSVFCEFALPRNVPLSSLQISLSQINTLAPVTITGQRLVQSPAPFAHNHRQTNPLRLLRSKSKDVDSTFPKATPSENQSLLASTVVYRLQAANGELLSPDIALDGDTYVSLRINAAASQLLGTPAPRIRVGSYARSIVFLAQGAGPYRVVWIDPKDTMHALPLATLIPNYKAGQAVEADTASIKLDAVTSQAGDAAGKAKASRSAASAPVQESGANKPWLWGALGLALALLAGMAYSLFRSFKNKEMA